MKSYNMKKIPNLLSGARLISFPILIVLIYLGEEQLFSIWFCINLLTDILDGWIARRFDASTPFGAKLDSLADMGSYVLAVYGIYQFHWDAFETYKIWLFAFIIVYCIAMLTSILKFKTFPSLHLYSFKISGYIQGIFLGILFIYQFIPWLFIVAMIVGIIANIEEFASLLKLKEMKSNIKTYFTL